MTVYWALGAWAICATAFVVVERTVARGQIWDATDKTPFRVFMYALFLFLSPALVVFGLVFGGGHWTYVGFRRLIGKPLWLNEDVGSLLIQLIKRRKKYDKRLSEESLGQWPIARAWAEPEAAIYDITEKYIIATSDGLRNAQIYRKINESRAAFGNDDASSLIEYVTSCLIPDYVALGEKLIQQQVNDCKEYVRQKIATSEPYPPARLLREKLAEEEIEQLETRVSLVLIAMHREMEMLLFRMMEGDEVWSYSAGSASGVALVRNGRSIAHVETLHVNPSDMLPRNRRGNSI